MITLFIRTQDQLSGDVDKDLGRCHRGYVVECIDGVVTGGKRDRERPDLKILHIDMPLAEGVALTSAEPGDRILDRMLRRRRMFRLDIDALPPPIRTVLEDTSQATTISLPASIDSIRAVKIEIPKQPDPGEL